MSRHQARAFVAVAAAYAVALQALLLAVSVPTAGANGIGTLPICSTLDPGHSPPAGHAGDCLGPCVGCCCGPPSCPAPGPRLTYVPMPAPAAAVALVAVPLTVIGGIDSHRSRAPPFA